jgi:transcriptional antiterminator RfaH
LQTNSDLEQGNKKMQAMMPAWYSARTKPKHEHIATANLRRHLALEVFFPKISLEKMTRRGLMRVVEPLFPCYIFIRCVVEEKINEIQHASGIGRLVHFGNKIPQVPDLIIEELQACFGADDLVAVDNRLAPGDEVTVAEGAFAGMSAQVLKSLPAKKRVQILLDILGRPITVEVGRGSVVLKKNSLADLAPFLAAPASQEMLRA